MEGKRINIDTRLEEKLGFQRIRNIISDRCSTAYASERAASETFSTNPGSIRKRLLLTDEMRLIMMFEDSFPTGGFIDCIDFLKPLENSSSAIDLISLRKLRTMLDTLRKVTGFFEGVKDGAYPASSARVITLGLSAIKMPFSGSRRLRSCASVKRANASSPGSEKSVISMMFDISVSFVSVFQKLSGILYRLT